MPREHHRIAITCLIAALVILICGCDKGQPTKTAQAPAAPSPQVGVDNTLRSAKQFAAMGDMEKARKLIRQVLLQSPTSPQTNWEIIALLRSMNAHSEAADLIEQLPVAAIIKMNHVAESFDSLIHSKRFDLADSFLRDCIEAESESPVAHRLLAQLLNSQGRRFEASQSVLELIRLRSVTRLELLSLVDVSGPYLLVDFRPVLGDASTTLFGMHEARQLWFSSRPDRVKAIQQLEQIDQRHSQHPAYVSLALRFYAENSQWQHFQDLLAKRPESVDQYPDYWQAIGAWYFHRSDVQNAAAAWIECLKLDPTNRSALRTLIASQDSLDEDSTLKLQSWLADLDKLFRMARDATPDQASWIAKTLRSRIRPWEATAWSKITAQANGQLASMIQNLNATHAQILQWESKYSLDDVRTIRLQQNLPAKLQGLALPIVPLSRIAVDSTNTNGSQSDQQRDRVFRFNAVAKRSGIDTSYVNAYPANGSDFRLYQANGGGLAVIDYDLDGNLDAYVAQAGGEPYKKDSVANQLFRQTDEQFRETTQKANVGDLGYGQGICVGDVNQDGLPDIIVANIGDNVLFVNQGDGTFLQRDDKLKPGSPSWTSSIGLADLDGDHLPDLVAVNYINDPDAMTARCKSPFDQCQPQSYRAAKDQFYRLSSAGTFDPIDKSSQDNFLDSDTDSRYGFGLIIANFDDRFGNDLFISNDGDLNHFWQSTGDANEATSKTATYRLAESAALTGCAAGHLGNAQACMGVAAGDMDGNGRLDLHVCNFYGESSNLFLQVNRGFFSDATIRRGIEPVSKQQLGFGTQGADFDNDGRLDLFVLNGHLFDRKDGKVPFRMKPQLLTGTETGFIDAKVESDADHESFWERPALGRTVAQGDFNRDGRLDLICNHLDGPVELLRNQTDEAGHWVTLELVGVDSERDAIGAKVIVTNGKQKQTAWMIGGDGYMCTNEACVHIGLGSDSESIERIDIEWPSGQRQQFANLSPDARYLVVEGSTQVFARPE